MTDATAEDPAPPERKSKLPLLLGAFLALAGAGGGYFSVQSGLLALGESSIAAPSESAPPPLDVVGYVPIDPIVVSLSADQTVRHLRFTAQLEVKAGQEQDVASLLPRILDVLNGYLRALRVSDLEDSFALPRLRAQMLRRVQVVVGDGRVRDLLITEFVLN